jgi:hypothetical protein
MTDHRQHCSKWLGLPPSPDSWLPEPTCKLQGPHVAETTRPPRDEPTRLCPSSLLLGKTTLPVQVQHPGATPCALTLPPSLGGDVQQGTNRNKLPRLPGRWYAGGIGGFLLIVASILETIAKSPNRPTLLFRFKSVLSVRVPCEAPGNTSHRPFKSSEEEEKKHRWSPRAPADCNISWTRNLALQASSDFSANFESAS